MKSRPLTPSQRQDLREAEKRATTRKKEKAGGTSPKVKHLRRRGWQG